MTDLQIIASKLHDHNADIQVLYAFNSVGKTRLSLEFQNLTKDNDGNHSGSVTTHTVKISLSGKTISRVLNPIVS